MSARQCIYEFDPVNNVLFSEVEAGNGEIENSHSPNADAIAIFADSLLYVNTDECTSGGEVPKSDALSSVSPEVHGNGGNR